MIAAAPEALARRFVAIQATVHPLYLDHGALAPGASGLDALRAVPGLGGDACPDLRFAADGCFADGTARVALRLVVTGTHTRPFLGLAPMGRVVRVAGLAVYRRDAGQLVEVWSHVDTLGLLRQLGAAPHLGERPATRADAPDR
ncbi:MAG TPA: ester cyclase [Thermomicrobiales bacterium]|nr:ester cyclase [Thermomicrobiales bacterium]